MARASSRGRVQESANGLLTFAFHPAVGRAERVVNVFDAAGLGLFCVTGAAKALDYGLGPVPAAISRSM